MVSWQGAGSPVTVAAEVVLLLVTAKAHGVQLRLERERAGHADVTFGSEAVPPEVRALWRAERVRFWPLAALSAGFAIVAGRAASWAWTWHAALAWAPSLAFVVTGLWSMWRSGAWRGAAAWWAIAAALAGLVALLTTR